MQRVIHADVVAALDERAARASAEAMVRLYGEAGNRAGDALMRGIDSRLNDSRTRIVGVGNEIGQSLSRAIEQGTAGMSRSLMSGWDTQGRSAARSFGSGFTAQLVHALPIGGLANALSGYDTAAGKAGAVAGRAMGMAFTGAAAGIIGVAGYSLFKGFERYAAIDAAKNRLENLNRTLAATGRATIDVGRVMDTVNASVADTPFALDKAFSIATRALASNTGDLQRFMTVVTDSAGFAGGSIDDIGEAFLKVANKGKLSMEEVSNELRNMPILPWLQEQLGVTGAELAKMITAGKVGLGDLMNAVEANTAGFAKSAGDTVEGALSNLKTSAARAGANVLSALFGKPASDGNDLVDVLKTLRERMDDVSAWINDHGEDIRKTFEGAIEVGGDLLSAIKDIADGMGGMDNLIKVAGASYVAWKTIGAISTVSQLATSLGLVNTSLGSTPALASRAVSALGPLAAIATAIGASMWWSDFIDDKIVAPPPVMPNMPTNLDGTPKAGSVPVIPGMAPAPTVQGIPSVGGIPIPGLSPVQAPQAGQVINGMPLMPGHGLHWDDAKGWVPDAGVSAPVGAPSGAPILPASGAGGGSGSNKTQLPFPEDYGKPPAPGESVEAWRARMANIEAEHDVAEKRARLTELEADSNSDANDVIKARNDVIEAEMRQWETQQRFNDSRMQAAGASVAYAEGYNAAPRPGQTAAQYSAEGSLFESQQKTAQARAEFDQLQATGTASTEQLTAAHNKFIKAQRDEYEAQLRLSDAYKTTSSQLSDLGTQLDADFGVSKGLPGIAENITKFLANLAFAPVLGALKGVQAAVGYDKDTAGSGLAGILSGGMGGNRVGVGGAGFGGGGSAGFRPAGMSMPAGGVGGAPTEDQVKQIAAAFGLQVTSEDRPGDPGYHGQGMALDVSNGSGNTPQMAAFADYMSKNFGSNLKELIYSDPAFSGLIGDGQNVTGGSYYSPDTLSEHRNHVHVAAQWGSGGSGLGGAGGGAGFAGMPSGFGGQDAFASNIIAQAQAAGLNREQTLSALAVASQESNMGANPAAYRPQNQNGTPGISGPFQQDQSYSQYGDRNDPATAARGFIDQYVRTGQGLNNPDPWQQALAVQRPAAAANGGYDASTLQAGQRATAEGYYNRLAGSGGGGMGTGIGPGMAGLPRSGPFGGPFPTGGPGLIGPGIAPGGGAAAPSQSVGGGRAWGQGLPESGGLGFGGGLIGMAQSAAGTAASVGSMGMGGQAVGALAQMGFDQLNRAAGAAGQYVGALGGGIMESLSLNESALADPSSSWLGRIMGAAAGARPALANTAGAPGGAQNEAMAEAGKTPQPPGPLTPEQAAEQAAANGANAGNQDNSTTNTTNINVTNSRATEDGTGRDIQAAVGASNSATQTSQR